MELNLCNLDLNFTPLTTDDLEKLPLNIQNYAEARDYRFRIGVIDSGSGRIVTNLFQYHCDRGYRIGSYAKDLFEVFCCMHYNGEDLLPFKSQYTQSVVLAMICILIQFFCYSTLPLKISSPNSEGNPD
jgi:hypothetical protein